MKNDRAEARFGAGFRIGHPHRRALRGFRRSEDGGITIEFVLWLPAFLALILLTADASLAFMRQSNFWTVSRDTARIVSRHGLDSAAAERYAANLARFNGYTPDVSVLVDDQASTVTVTITGEATRMAPFGVLSLAVGGTVSAQVTQALEPI
jgi:Flp pilus assembly protein TadG